MIQSLEKDTKRVTDNLRYLSIENAVQEVQTLLGKGSQYISYPQIKEENIIFTDEVVQDYIKLNKGIHENMISHAHSLNLITRNFKIKKEKNIDLIISILQQEAHKNNPTALNTLGFLYYHGITVNRSRSLAFEYFKNSAREGDLNANFACFCLSETIS